MEKNDLYPSWKELRALRERIRQLAPCESADREAEISEESARLGADYAVKKVIEWLLEWFEDDFALALGCDTDRIDGYLVGRKTFTEALKKLLDK